MAFSGLIDTLFHSCYLEGSFYDIFDAETEVFDKEIFPQHTIAELNSGIRFIVLFSQEKPLPRKEINTHTYTQKIIIIITIIINNAVRIYLKIQRVIELLNIVTKTV